MKEVTVKLVGFNNNSRNGCVYPKEVIEKGVKEFNERIKNGEIIYGQIGQPDCAVTDITEVSHIVKEIELKENGEAWGKIQLLDTPNGYVADSVISGCDCSLAPRGFGSVDDKGYVSDYELITLDVVN